MSKDKAKDKKKKARKFKTFSQYQRYQEVTNGQTVPGEQFSVRPTVHSRFEEELTREADLLPLIANIEVEKEQSGKIMMEIADPVTSRTDTSDGETERTPTNVADTSDDKYYCQKMHFDALIPWDKVDESEQFKNKFLKLYQKMFRQRAARDRQMICLNGVSIAADSSHPALLDMDKGWIQKTREKNPGNVFSEIVPSSNEVNVGSGGDYNNLDALISEMKTVIPYHLRSDLITLIDGDILAAEETKLYSAQAGTPTEKLKIKEATESYGALRTFAPDFMPLKTVMITSLMNLAFYWLAKSWQRSFENSHKKEGYIDWNRYKGTPEVQNYEKIVVVENIEMV